MQDMQDMQDMHPNPGTRVNADRHGDVCLSLVLGRVTGRTPELALAEQPRLAH